MNKQKVLNGIAIDGDGEGYLTVNRYAETVAYLRDISDSSLLSIDAQAMRAEWSKQEKK